MSDLRDARYQKCESAICDALAEILKSTPLDSVEMSCIARKANISRSTLYAHYNNVMDIYKKLVSCFMKQVQTFEEHFSCEECTKESLPYCVKLRNAGKYSGVVKQAAFPAISSSVTNRFERTVTEDDLIRAGLSKNTAKAIAIFQMSGCQAVATSDLTQEEDWSLYQKAIDDFIRGGLRALGVNLNRGDDAKSVTCPIPLS